MPKVKKYFENIAKALLKSPFKSLNKSEQKIIASIAEQKPVSENVNETYSEQLTFGEKIADKVASFGGSWSFIIFFALLLAGWIFLNSYIFINKLAVDPFPFILLNLCLSALAAFQAPIIMMSQNRQVEKDRMKQEATYEINLKLELEIMRLHEKIDRLEIPKKGE